MLKSPINTSFFKFEFEFLCIVFDLYIRQVTFVNDTEQLLAYACMGEFWLMGVFKDRIEIKMKKFLYKCRLHRFLDLFSTLLGLETEEMCGLPYKLKLKKYGTLNNKI